MRRIRFTAVVEVKDDELAEKIAHSYIHPLLSDLTSAYWKIGTLQSAGAEGEREWAEGEVASYRFYERRAADQFRNQIIRELAKGSWRDTETMQTVFKIIREMPVPEEFR